jgi:FSR family fosmidomycin resistance protein-like MFS transporter
VANSVELHTAMAPTSNVAVRAAAVQAPERTAGSIVLKVLVTLSLCHFLNDMVQSLIPAIYPILKNSFQLDFGQIGLITLTGQLTGALLQPFVGIYTDRKPLPYFLPVGMGFTLVGLLLLSTASYFTMLLLAVGLVGIGSSVFHPESSRVARLASGGNHGLAQSLFQLGGNAGAALGPLLAALIVVRRGQRSIAWFSIAALLAILLLTKVSGWYKNHANKLAATRARLKDSGRREVLPRGIVVKSMVVLIVLIFSKHVYLASLTNYYTFFLMNKFHVSVQNAQMHLFAFLAAVAAGTIIGGPVGDRIGRKQVIWGSIVGVLPFTLVLPYANLFWTGILSVLIGLILASAFSAILVYAQELVPGRVGMISGLFFGFAFGMSGIAAALLGKLADLTSLSLVYQVCAFLPLLGILTAFLPDLGKAKISQPQQA